MPAQGQPPAVAVAGAVVAPAVAKSKAAPSASAAQPASAASGVRAPSWIAVPLIAGRFTNQDIGVVINTAGPYSVEVGKFYVRARKIPLAHVMRVELPVRAKLTPDEVCAFHRKVSAYFGAEIWCLRSPG